MVPKTLVFAKDDSHAEDIVHLVREVFGKGNDFAKKITYQAKNAETGKAAKGEELIQQFRTSPQLRIAVTGGHDRDRHRHQAAGMPAVYARCAQPRVLRADERTRHTSTHADRFAGGERCRCPRRRRTS
jgi:hypothetical protein